MSAKKTIPVGTRFARLIVIAPVEPAKKQSRSLCLCDCGKEAIVPNLSLKTGNTGSCGCMGSRYNHPIKHGHSHSPTWNCWKNMLRRCKDPKDIGYHNYGGRGISVCDRWREFRNFLADMGARPDGLTIERIDNDGSYSPDNCKWATRKEQQRNQRTTRIIEIGGVRRCLVDWFQYLNVPSYKYYRRKKKGWTDVAALTL